MESLQRRVETWIRDQRTKILRVTWPPPWPRIVVKWPWVDGGREQKKKIEEALGRRNEEFRYAVKAESVSDLQEILCCMVLAECVYKRPAAEMVRAVNKFKADFGGQLVSLERVQPSSDHVPHSGSDLRVSTRMIQQQREETGTDKAPAPCTDFDVAYS